MHSDRTFPISAVLPPTPEGAALARFLILSRQADHLHAALAGRSGDAGVLTLEARLVLLGCYIGSIKELADASAT